MTQPGDESDLFLSLTPERVLDAVEAAGVAIRLGLSGGEPEPEDDQLG